MAIAFNLEKKLCIVLGTHYGGENKKGIFSLMNYLLPLQGIMSMHCSANVQLSFTTDRPSLLFSACIYICGLGTRAFSFYRQSARADSDFGQSPGIQHTPREMRPTHRWASKVHTSFSRTFPNPNVMFNDPQVGKTGDTALFFGRSAALVRKKKGGGNKKEDYQ